ncbi:MAG: hypothetical protein IKY53_07530 [Lachnospiraceae bacterium]|nr:hypothetical protein [Lachnospiraceae bacterium]
MDYEFSCEYCKNKLRGLSSDEYGYPNCGASYQNNLELLIREEEDKVEKCHYEQYQELNKIKTEQNEKNNKDDVAHYKKYGKLYKMNDLTTNPVVGMFKMFFLMFLSLHSNPTTRCCRKVRRDTDVPFEPLRTISLTISETFRKNFRTQPSNYESGLRALR